MDLETVSVAVGLAIAVVTLSWKILSYLQNIRERLVKVETKTDLFMAALQSWSVKVLHSPHAPDRDHLLEKLEKGSITREEAKTLRGLLALQYDGDPRSTHGLAYTLLLARLDEIIGDRGDS